VSAVDILPPQAELFPIHRPAPAQTIAEALEYKPIAIYALFSGGDGSLRATHWYMNNVPGCRPAHIVTGIGLKATERFVDETCQRYGWDLEKVRAKEDCGQDYDEIVLKHGFPGPASHSLMYRQLKERGIEKLVRDAKTKRSDKVMFLTGIQHDDSERRSGYGNAIITPRRAQLWVNALYWSDRSATYHYLQEHQIPRNPVAIELGMSGECGCGAFASKGELRIWRRVCPAFGARIDRLQEQCRERGVHHNWEERPPRERADKETADLFAPLCTHCIKSPERLAA
jgi:3'-phosphoadenosine 5'-phosphosulfate sulfotransferase (PAPS reductase)/FAD synthetase